MDFQCAILAGGENSRYGGFNKAFILVDGEKIIDRNIKILQSLFTDISFITNFPDQFIDYTQFPMSKDYYKGIGPLAGIHSALQNSRAHAVLIISCDMPFLSQEVISELISLVQNDNYMAVIPRWENKIEPLCAIYKKSLLPVLEEYIESNSDRSVRGFLRSINCKYMDLKTDIKTRKAFLNINSPSDLEDYASNNYEH